MTTMELTGGETVVVVLVAILTVLAFVQVIMRRWL